MDNNRYNRNLLKEFTMYSQENIEEERFQFNFERYADNDRIYNDNIIKNKNVIIDTDNLELSSNITFPWLRIIDINNNAIDLTIDLIRHK